MTKHFITSKQLDNDWYGKARDFLSENIGVGLDMRVSDAPASVNAALAEIANLTGSPIILDDEAALVVVTATEGDEIGLRDCACDCGGKGSCSGSGSGAGQVPK